MSFNAGVLVTMPLEKHTLMSALVLSVTSIKYSA